MSSTTAVQAWIDVGPDDPEAYSAWSVARRLPAGSRLAGLERRRLVEVRGPLGGAAEIARRLHASTQFYNPHKERCVVRERATDPAPVPPGARLALVWERGGARRPAAERWWREETGATVEVREAQVWVLRFEAGAAEDAADDLVRLRGAREGLLANPWSQASRLAGSTPPLPWIDVDATERT